MTWRILTLVAALGLARFLSADESGKPAEGAAAANPAEEEIRKSARDFTEAFAAGDAKAIANLFAKNAEYSDDSGIVLKGRDQIEKAYTQLFKEAPKGRMEVKVESIRFPSPDVALEEGTIVLHPAGADLPTCSRYSVMHIKEDGQWKTSMTREWQAEKNNLAELQWLVGTWTAKRDKGQIHLNFHFNPKQTFLICDFRVEEGDKVISSGKRIIGEDPGSSRIRSWSFYDEGGHSESLWFHDGDRWMIETVGILSEGEPIGELNILARVNPNEFSWQSVDRVIGDEPVPDSKPVKVTRVAAAQAAK